MWADLTQARAHWADANPIPDDVLTRLLIAATEATQAYARASAWRVLTDAETAAASTALTSALGAFSSADVDRLVMGDGIPSSTRIVAVPTATTVTLSAPATATATGVTATVLPVSHMLATVYQAREVYQAALRDGDVIGVGDFVIRSRPLTASVKALLRPQAALGVVG